MKRLLLLITSIVTIASAQNMDGKLGHSILPEAGDLSISMSANPFLNYVGKVAGGNATTPPAVDFVLSDMQLSGRYFLSETKALRGYLRIGVSDTVERAQVILSNNIPLELEDKRTYTNVWIGAGMEWRRGKYGRFQGYYGGELALGYTSAIIEDQVFDAANDRADVQETKIDPTITIAAQAFIGVEYFFLAKVSLSGEVGWGVNFVSIGDQSFNNGQQGAQSVITPGGSTLSLDTGLGWTNGNLKLNFCF